MCLSLVGCVQAVEGAEAVLDLDGAPRRVSLAALVLDGQSVTAGDWVLVHTGLAVSVLEEGEARAVLAARATMKAEGGP